MNSGLFHPWIRVLRRSAVAYGDTLFSAIFLRYNFPRCSAQGGFANIYSSGARVEIELYSHCFMQSLTYLTEHAHAQGRNSPLFHWPLWGTQVLPNFLPDGLLKTEDGLRATQAQKPPEVTGTFTGTPQHAGIEHRAPPPAQGKSSPAAAGRQLRFMEDT